MRLDPPTILTGKPPETNFHRGDIWVSYEPADIGKIQNAYRAKHFILGKFDVTSFTRMLAKIAYAHAVSMMGYGSFSPLVLDVIFARTNIPSHWVGGDLKIPSAEGVIHQLKLNDDYRVNGRRYIVADIRLFALLGAPVYRVVVGEPQS